MKKSEYDEEQLEELLREMPKIRDHRDPRDIYQNITLKLNKRKKRTWVIPSLATAAAILLFVILAPNLMSWNDSALDSSEESTASEPDKLEMAKMEEGPATFSTEENELMRMYESAEENMEMTTFDAAVSYTALYESDITDENVFTFAIPDEQVQNMVPVSVIVPKEDGKAPIDQLNETMTKLTEEQWGLSEYYPLNAELSIDNEENVLNVHVPSNHIYGDGSAAEIAFVSMIREAANSTGAEKVALYTDNQPGMDFGNHGFITDLDVSTGGNKAYYLYYPNEGRETTETPYLVPFAEPFENIESALEAMRGDIDTHSLHASIPAEVLVSEISSSDEELLTLEIEEEVTNWNEPMLIHMIEAILLTAKEFNYDKVKIEYPENIQVGKFIFNEEWNVPLAPNKRIISQ